VNKITRFHIILLSPSALLLLMQQQIQELPARQDEANCLHSVLSDKTVLLLNETM